jgi:uncharacterized protein YegP (UPF0339 family)
MLVLVDFAAVIGQPVPYGPNHWSCDEGYPMYKFEVYQDKAGEYRFRFKASNGEIMFTSEGYTAKASALKSIDSIKKNVPGASVDDQTVAVA